MRALLIACALLVGAPVAAEVVRCPDGSVWSPDAGNFWKCPCCPTCPDGSKGIPGGICRELVSASEPDPTPRSLGDIFTGIFGLVLGLALVFGAVVLYFVPTIVTGNRKHHQKGAILALNLLLGWTALGWIAALVWAFTAVRATDEKGRVS